MTAALATFLALWLGMPDDADVRGAVRHVYEDERFQQEWPRREASPIEPPTTGGVDRGGDLHRRDDRAPEAHGRRVDIRVREPSRSDPSPVWEALLWILAAVGVAWIVAAIVSALRTRRADVKVPAAPPAPARAGSGPAVPLTPAEALAAEGRYAEAIHALWLEALAVIGRGATLDPALTSREVLERLRLAPARREAVGGLVSAVEVSLFGGRPAGEPDWLACRERHRVALAPGPAVA